MDPTKKDDTKPEVQTPETAKPVEETKTVTPPTVEAPVATSPEPVSPVVPATPVEPAKPIDMSSVATPAPAVPMDQTAGVKTKSNNMIYIVIAILIAILLGLAGLFFYRQFSSATNKQAEINVPTPVAATPTIVVPTYASPEEKDVMGIDVGNVDSQLKIIEDDVKKL